MFLIIPPNPTTIDLTLIACSSSAVLTCLILVLHFDCGAVSSSVQTTPCYFEFTLELHGGGFSLSACVVRPCDPSNLVSLCPFYMRLLPEMHQPTCSHGSCSASCFAMDTMKGRISVKHLVLVLVSAPQAPPGFQRPPLTRTMTSVIGGVGATGDGACFCWALLDSGTSIPLLTCTGNKTKPKQNIIRICIAIRDTLYCQ